MSDPAQIQATVERFFHQVCDLQRLELLESILAPGFLFHLPPDRLDRIDEVRAGFERLFNAFPDLQYTLCDVLVADGEAMVRWRGNGSHLGPYGCIPPTGRAFHYEGVTVMAMDELGRITQTWMDTNLKAMLERLKVS